MAPTLFLPEVKQAAGLHTWPQATAQVEGNSAETGKACTGQTREMLPPGQC